MIEEDHRRPVHAPGQRVRVVDACLEERARNVELLVRQRPLGAAGDALDERVLDRQLRVVAHRRGRADRQQRPTSFDEFHQLRHGPRDADATETIAEFRRDRFRRRLVADELAGVAAGTRAAAAAVPHRDPVVDEDQYVVFGVQVARIERLREHDLERKLVLLEHPADPA